MGPIRRRAGSFSKQTSIKCGDARCFRKNRLVDAAWAGWYNEELGFR